MQWVPKDFDIVKLGSCIPPTLSSVVNRHLDIHLAVDRQRRELEALYKDKESWPSIRIGPVRLITDVGREWDSNTYIDIRDPWQRSSSTRLVLDSPATFYIPDQGWKFSTQLYGYLDFETGNVQVDTRSLVYIETEGVDPPIDPFIWGYGFSIIKPNLNRKQP